MTEYHDHRDDCPFKFAPLDACDCVEKNMLDRIEALTKERDALRSALGRIRPVPERILRGIPVRDLAETLAEADSALSKGA